MKVLFIGNSFSQDANIYLHRLCEAAGVDAEFLDLIIGGCSFERHANNIEGNLKNYMVQYNGHDYGEEIFCTMEDGLKYRDWDYISIQQVSGYSGRYETFHPYVDTLVNKIRQMCPRAKIIVHETWAYDHGAKHSEFPSYNSDPTLMTERLCEAYTRLVSDVSAIGLVPCGEVIQALRDTPTFDVRQGGTSLHRDGFHLSYDYGRYAAAATWFTALGLGDIMSNTALPDGENIDTDKIALIKRTVKDLVKPIV